MSLSSGEIRKQFIDFFVEKHGHTFAPSSPVVPHDDPTLLFTNAGMNQFKPAFLGTVDPSSDLAKLRRAANSQKCIRAGGKHNDLDDVGKDLYHHTFFEMLGNWSFGDYFKAEAIQWAWELLTGVWGLDPDRLYATYFEGDQGEGLEPDLEARELWLRHLPESRVLPGDMKDNFWEMGDTGPCGPCSEVHYDGRADTQRADIDGRNLVNADHPDVIELWNLVFIQFDRFGPGASGLKSLPARHVDTGMGLERITRVLQGQRSNYATDVFTPLFEKIREVCEAPPYTDALDSATDMAYRVIADHVRTLTFAITDGADPSNEGRGYVLRRVLRRAVRYGRQTLGAQGPFICDLVPTLVEQMGGFFPELRKNPKRVADVIRDEEESFGRTLDVGLQMFTEWATLVERVAIGDYVTEEHATDAPTPEKYATGKWIHPKEVQIYKDAGAGVIPAEAAFKLHDTYGFPIDLTQIMAEERGLAVDVEGFERLMEEARERSRAGGGSGAGADRAATLDAEAVATLKRMGVEPTDDSAKFEHKAVHGATVRAVWNGSDFDQNARAGSVDERFAVITDSTSFYGEMGGQVGDTGEVVATGGDALFRVEDTRSVGGHVLHVGRMERGELSAGDEVELRLDGPRRARIAGNHTSTHLLNLALREQLGDAVDQKGSLVAPDRLRFDFSHGQAVTPEEIERIHQRVRARIDENLEVHAKAAPLGEAKKITGLRAVFGETYPDPVRVVSIGPEVDDLLAEPSKDDWREYSIEFCGGTHLERTGEAGAFAVVEETAVAKGVRRVTAITGDEAKEAVEAGERLVSRVTGAKDLPDERLEREAGAIADELEGATLPVDLKSKVRIGLESLQARLKEIRKRAAKAGRNEAVDAARALASEAGGDAIVGLIPAGSDRQALLAAMDAVRAKHDASAILLVSPDDAEGKVAIAASVPDGLIKKGLKAGDWVRTAAAACGGKGGGKPDKAQGGGTEPERAGDAVDAAKRYAIETIGA